MQKEPNFDPPVENLRSSVGRGATAIAASQGVQVACQMVSVVVLSRLLSPEDFGLVAMCAPVIAFLGMLQNFGLVQATIQKKDLLASDVNFLFWINVGISIVLAAGMILTSPLIADFYGDQRIGPLLAALSATIVISGLGAQHSALLNRRMAFGTIAMLSVTGAVCALVVSIAWAMVNPSYWALFGGTFCAACASTALTWYFSRWRPSRPARAPGMRSLLSFGAGLTGFNLTNFFARNLDNILIGKVWGSAQLGFYDRAYKLLLFPLQQVSNPLSRVMIPALSRMLDEPDRYRHAYLRVLKLSLLLILPGVAWATASASELILVLLGPQWIESASIFTALGFAGLMQPLNNPAGWLFISQGRSTHYMIWGFVTAAFAICAFAIGIWWAALGVAIAYACSEYLKTVPLWLFISRTGPVKALHILKSAGPFVLAGHLAAATLFILNDNITLPPLVTLGCGLVISYLVTILALLPFSAGRQTFMDVLAIAKDLVGTGKLSRDSLI